MIKLFQSTPYNPEVAEHLVSLGFCELRESITDPAAERHIIVNQLTKTTWTCDTINLENSADIVSAKYKEAIHHADNSEILLWPKISA